MRRFFGEKNQQQSEARIMQLADTYRAKQGLDRREFLKISSGMAAAFLAMNRMFTKLTGVGIALALYLMGTTAWVNAQGVTDSMLLSDPATSWLHTNGNLAGHRYNVLTQLDASNVDQLNVAWIFSPGGETDAQNTPLYHDGIVYFAQDNKVFAIDARSGWRVWKYVHELPETFGGYNIDFITGKHLGLAIYGHNIYFLSNDTKLHAIDYKTGEQKWVRQYLNYPEYFERTEDGDSNGYATTVGPMALPGGQIIVPLSGTDFGGLPGWVYGVNSEDGEILWECNMIPGPGEPGYKGWLGESAEYATGPRSTGSWDSELKMYYATIGNTHSWNPKTRGDGKLDGLGAASVVACSTEAGKAAWRSVMVFEDQSDLNIVQTPMVIALDGRKNIVYPDRNGGILYLDAATGQFLHVRANRDRMNLIEGYDEEGRPVGRLDLLIEDDDAVEVWPSLFGGVNMHPNAYNPLTGNLYMAAANVGTGCTGDKFEKLKVISNVCHFGTSVEFVRLRGTVDVGGGGKQWRQGMV